MVNPTELETLNAPQLRELTRELVERLSEQQHENAETIASLKRELLFKSTRIEQLTYELARYKLNHTIRQDGFAGRLVRQ